MLHIGEKINASGQLLYRYDKDCYETNVNYSGIFTELIQAAGSLCEFYASDLYYTLSEIKTAVDNTEEKILYIGIYTNGVDGTNSVREKMKWQHSGYIRLYRLIMSAVNSTKSYVMELERVDEYDVRKALTEN